MTLIKLGYKFFGWLQVIYLYLVHNFRYPVWIKSLRFKWSNTYDEKYDVYSLGSEEKISLSNWSDDEYRYT